MYCVRTQLWRHVLAVLTVLALKCTALSSTPIVVYWNNAALDLIREEHTPPTEAVPALAIVHTCIYDAWALETAGAWGV